MTVRLARAYGLAMRVFDRETGALLRQQGLPTSEHQVVDTCAQGNLRDLPAGPSEWAAHPALDTPEIRAYEPESWQMISTDLDVLTSQEACELIAQEGIVLLSYRHLQQVWQARGAGQRQQQPASGSPGAAALSHGPRAVLFNWAYERVA